MQDNKLHPIIAWRALRDLLRDPEDTAKVFVILRALTGKSILRGYNRFAATPTGAQLLAEQRSLLDTLSDREALRAMPEGSLGRAYLQFVEQENLSADGLVDASVSETDGYDEGSPIAYYSQRIRDMHDLWHVTTDYGRDTLGELCLLGFTYAQTSSPGLALIIAAGTLKHMRILGSDVIKAVRYGYQNGKRANWLPAEIWEELLPLPLNTVRQRLNVAAPEVYPQLRLAATAA